MNEAGCRRKSSPWARWAREANWAASPSSRAKPRHTNLTGTIANDDVAVLRVYRAVDLNAILSLNHGSPDRVDLPLDPGKSDIDIIRQNGQLAGVPHGATSP